VHRARRLVLSAAALALVLRGPPAAALPKDAALSDAEVARRIAFIEGRFARGDAAANRWWNAWFYGFTALTVAQGVLAIATTDPGLRTDSAVGAASSSLGVMPLGLSPLPARFAVGALRALPDATPAERRRKLARAEELLRESAEAEALGRSWLNHALGGGVSVGVGLVLGFVYKRPGSAVLNTVSGIALSELQIFTQPTAAIDDQRAYERWIGMRRAPATAHKNTVEWALIPQPCGLFIAGHF
jgi:hypothetical protein